MTPPPTTTLLDRRTVLTGATVGTAATLLAGCGLLDSPEPCPVPTSGSVGTEGTAGTPRPSTGPRELVALADIEIGGAVVVPTDDRCGAVAVARTTETTAVAFAAVCPHRGVVVDLDDGRLLCPAHGAAFDVLTGDVLDGPAETGLVPVPVRVVNGTVVEGAVDEVAAS
jgi:nitrite reductase/ring-hydroxylating ferredoxin subunit